MSDILFSLNTTAGWINFSTNAEAIEQNLFGYFGPHFEMGPGHAVRSAVDVSLLLEPQLDLKAQMDGTERPVRLLGSYAKEQEFLVLGKKRVQGRKKEFFIRADDPDVKVTVEKKRVVVVGSDPRRIACGLQRTDGTTFDCVR